MRAKIGRIHLFILLTSFFLAGSVAAQQKFEPTVNSRREAIAKGRVKEFQAAMEAMASEAEKKWRWAEAAQANGEASYTAKSMGQLAKAISLGTKAVELGGRAKDLYLQSISMQHLALAYADVGQPEKERQLLKEALGLTKAIPGNREVLEARLYRQLARNYLRQREHKEAIEYASYSVQILESPGGGSRRLRNPRERQAQIFNGLNVLGYAYLEAGNFKEAIKAFERCLKLSETAPNPTVDHVLGLGRAYLAEKDFARAAETISKALQVAEARRQTSTIQAASSAIGEIFLQTEKPSEAIPYYKKAIDSIESTRSLLESEEFRTSFFDDKGRIYGGVISAHLGAKNVEDAFNYNERARSRTFLDILGNKLQLSK